MPPSIDVDAAPQRRFDLTPVYIGLALVALAPAALIIATPLSATAQALFGVGAVVLAILISNWRSRPAKFILAAFTLIVSTRYMYWRLTETLEFASFFEALLGYGMVGAELYLWLVLVLSFFQTLSPRNRKPAPLPDDQKAWPTVDVFIPTYNEPLDVVRPTVLAATKLDYPKTKVRVFILDDGRRSEFRAFAEEAGVEYIARSNNDHAKAGNLNHALAQTDGDLVAIFDCDHAPTRGFLQLTTGWFLKDRKLALLQTPHYFYNKDPFEKNLAAGDEVPNEGLLFYGMIQDGNDFWNASFFCGSCAVLRREALDEIGGVAVETVTEDAHTSLKLQRKGWNTGFIRFPLAAGLATTSLADHIKQRMRWARGMVQIFRKDNPFLGAGLSIAQRLCYANAMLHFLFPIPRFVLLTAPLAFLLFNQHVIIADAWMILAYALPHFAIATVTSNAVQGRHRHPFWAEIYEVALSFHLIRPTLTALAFPNRGKFNVTSKDSGAEQTYFDGAVVFWHLVAAAALMGAIILGGVRIFLGEVEGGDAATTMVNMFWGTISFLFIVMAAATALERRELRRQPRVKAELPAVVVLPSGHALTAQTVDISVTGANIACRRPEQWSGDTISVELPSGAGRAVVAAKVLNWTDDSLRVVFAPESVDESADIVRAVLGRADAWRSWDDWKEGGVWRSIGQILGSIGRAAAWAARRDRTQDVATAFIAAFALGALVTTVTPASVQAEEDTPPALAATVAATEASASRTLDLSLRDFGIAGPLRLDQPGATRGVAFTVRSDEVIRSARLRVKLAYSENFDPRAAELQILLNGQPVETLAIDPDYDTPEAIEVDVSPFLFFPDNDLVFTLSPTDASAEECLVETAGENWVEISHLTEIELGVQRLPVDSDLSALPTPFFDERDATELSLPFVFASRPSLSEIETAAAVASYWGAMARYRGAQFPVRFGDLSADNSIVFLTQNDDIDGLDVAPIEGPSLAVVENPENPAGRLLLIMGRDAAELRAAAFALVLRQKPLDGALANVVAPKVKRRRPYDAPNWIPTDRPVRFAELASEGALATDGLASSLLTVNFDTSPDLFVWGDDALALDLRLDYPDTPWIDADLSRLDIQINQSYLTSLAFDASRKAAGLAGALLNRTARDVREVILPSERVYGQNQLQF
ncbi:MAG: UDP-forming cellulose synthase catalytic subunit, partial [Pseudomonadota bacterium]